MTWDRCCRLGSLLAAGVLAFQALAADEEINDAAVGSYQEPGYAANRDFAQGQQVDSVDPFTGALKILTRDLLIPGNGGLDIEVLRNYQSVTNSHGAYSNGYRERTPFGTGWDLHFGRLWVSGKYQYLNQADNNRGCQIGNQVASNLNPILELPDGSRQVLANGNGQDHAFITKERWIGRCLPRSMNKGDGGLIVISPAGLKYIFDKKGTVSPDQQLRTYFVTRIEDPDGNFLNFTYNIGTHNLYGRHHLLKSIQASDGRSVHLTYRDETGQRPVLDSIVSNGVTLRYAYIDANWGIGAKPHYLESVHYPDGTRWSYSYNNASSLTGTVPGRFAMASMTSPTGLRTSYAYEYRQMGPNPAERLNVISRRTLSGIQGAPTEQVWEYQYAKGRAPNNDQTLVKGPLQCIGYEHVGADTVANGATGVNRGLWKVGALVRKYTAARAGSGCGPALRTESYTWTSQDISRQHEVRRYNLLVEDRTRAALLASKVVVQDGTSYSTRYTYDAYGQPLTVAEQGQLARTTTYTYVRPGGHWILGKVTSQTISGIPGAITSSYSNSGRLTQQVHFGVATTFGYTSTGDLATQVDANGRTTRHAGYFRGIAGTTTQPDGGVIRRTVNPTGTLGSITDPLGRVTRYSYDSMNRVTAVMLPKGGASNLAVSYAFGANGITETLKRANYTRVRQYNVLGQLINQRESGGSAPIVSAATYRADGQPATQSLPGYNQASTSLLTFEYDGLGRRILLRHADGSTISTRYAAANTQTQRDERGNVTTLAYAAFGEPSEQILIKTVQPGGITTTFGRDNLGRLLSIEQGGLIRRYTYDARGLLNTEVNPESQTTLYGYDAVGNRTSRKVGAAAADTFGYDAMNRLVRITHPNSQTFTFNYDLAGRLLSQTSYQGNTWNYTYDLHDLLVSESLVLTSPAARILTFRYSYNAQDSLQSITYPSGLVVDYAPDAYGRATQAGTYASAIAYHPDGQLSTLTYGNGRRLSVAVDARRLRVTERQVGGPDRPLHLRYAYDAASNPTQIADLQNSAYTQTLGYDALNRLTSARGIWGAASFAYNLRGDLTRQTLGSRVIDYGYDSQGRLASLGGALSARLSYDARGNILSAAGQYGYDHASRMTWLCLTPRADCATAPDERYRYDAAGRRVATTDAKGGLRISVYGRNGQLLREEDANGGVKEYIHVAGQLLAHREQCSDRDSDLDGMPDCYERRLGLDPADPRDSRTDIDGDGLSNADEYRLGTKLRNADSDNDGMPDGWEFQHKLNPLIAADAHLDANSDGISNLDSYRQGISPSKPDWPAVVPVMHQMSTGH